MSRSKENITLSPSVLKVMGAYMVVALCVHIFRGGPAYLDAFQVELSTDKLKAMATGSWHSISVLIATFGCVYWRLAIKFSTDLFVLVTAVQLVIAILFFILGVYWLGTIWAIPQWFFFLIGPVLTIANVKRAN